MVRAELVACTALLVGTATAFLAPSALRQTAVPRVAKASLRMSASDEPWFQSAVATVTLDKETLENAFAAAVPKKEEKKESTEGSSEQKGSSEKKSSSSSSGKQDFLEANPYHDMSSIPLNTYKNKAPFVGKVVSVKRIVGPKATGETCHIIIDHQGKMPYWEGQSYGVIPPGTNPKNGKPNSVRLYSIASSRYGDDMTGTTTSLCVRRATYWDAELGKDDPAKKGVCSNFLCDAKPGDEVNLTGPSGKVMLMPEAEDFKADLIMVATGTGIAPYRSMLRRLFVEKTPAAANYKGQAWLFLGVANQDATLYDDEWQSILKEHPKQFRLDYALSREETNAKGGKMYIQDKMEVYADEIFGKLENGAHMYFCGLKGMMPGILTMLEEVSKKKGLNWEEFLGKLKKAGQWHVEVY